MTSPSSVAVESFGVRGFQDVYPVVRRFSFAVFSMMVIWVCLVKSWSSWVKCLYRGRCVLVLDAALCSFLMAWLFGLHIGF